MSIAQAMSVQTACSSGLVAVAQAVDAIRLRRCEAALAGAVSIALPQWTGYSAPTNMIWARDGASLGANHDQKANLIS